MERLFQALLAGRPRGWSVVRGTDEIVVRPAERALGKVSVSPSPGGGRLYVSFFSHRRNRWTASDYFPLAEGTSSPIFDWALDVIQREGLRALP